MNHSFTVKRLVAVVATSMLVLTAACGSKNDSSSSGESGGKSAALASYRAQVKAAMTSLTDKAFPGPTKAFKAPRNLKLAIVPCSTSTEGCEAGAEAIKAAAGLLGWKSQIFDGKNDPITQGHVIEQAVNTGFDAIVLESIDPGLVKSALATAAKKGIPVGSMAQFAGASPKGIAFDVSADWGGLGKAMGAQVVVHSKGKARLLAMYDREFGSATLYQDNLVKTVKSCSTCSVAPTQDFVAADVGPQLGVRVVNILQNDPKITVVQMPYDGAASVVVPAIRQAGLAGKVTVVGNNGGNQNIEWIKKDQGQSATGVWSIEYAGYATIDQLARLLAHQPLIKTEGVSDPKLAYSESVPFALITADNVSSIKLGPVGPVFAVEDGLKSQFGKLWGVS